MDFPLDLDKSFATGMDEFKNTIEVLLRNHRGTFMQSGEIGTTLDVHCPEPDIIEDACRSCIEAIPNCTMTNCAVTINGRNVHIDLVVMYLDEIINFQFSYDNEV